MRLTEYKTGFVFATPARGDNWTGIIPLEFVHTDNHEHVFELIAERQRCYIAASAAGRMDPEQIPVFLILDGVQIHGYDCVPMMNFEESQIRVVHASAESLRRVRLLDCAAWDLSREK